MLVGADVASTYCYLLSLEEHRDAETWGVRLLELQDQGFAPAATIADFGGGLRAGQAQAMPEVACRGDVFHAEQTALPLVTFLENRAYDAIAWRGKIERKTAKTRRRGGRTQALGRQLAAARKAEEQAIALAEDAATLADWLRRDILSLDGPDHAARAELFDFVVAELKAREPLCPHRIGPVAGRGQSPRRPVGVRGPTRCGLGRVGRRVSSLPGDDAPRSTSKRWPRKTPLVGRARPALRSQLGSRFFAVGEAVADLARRTVRASSVIENLNSRLRNYFFLRRHLGAKYLTLLQFFLNHRRFLRSEHPERVGKSPAELLHGEAHPHWLEMLGYARFSRN